MAKKKTAGRISEGAKVRVREGTVSPEFPEISIAGWTGTASEVTGKPPSISVVLEWDPETLAKMPPEYIAKCEKDGLYHLMACLGEDALDAI